jgi:hypothetical protein
MWYNLLNLNPITSMKKLHHGQIVRVKSFTELAGMIRVFTLRGYALEYGNDPEEVIARARKNNHDLNPAGLQEAAVITADYPGKDAELRAHHKLIDEAPEIEDGETVTIEGNDFKVKVLGQRFSDPITFIPVTA